MTKSETQLTLQELREQLEEFALHLKPGTTKGKHRTAIFDTLELAKLVQALMQQALTSLKEEMEKKKKDTDPKKVKGLISLGEAQGFNSGISECQRVIDTWTSSRIN